MAKRILVVRATPTDLDINAYNVQQVGLGKAFVDMGYDYDFVTLKKDGKNCKTMVFYENNGCKARCIEKPRHRFLRWGINTEICKKEFLNQYDLVICQEYYQLQSYLVARNSKNVALYSGPYYNLFLPKWFSPLYDCLIGPKLNKLVRVKFVKSVLAENFLEKKGYTGLYNIGVGLDTERFTDVEITPDIQKLVDYMKTNECMLYVGALSDRKNYPFMLDLYQRLLSERPNLKFVVIGKSRMSFWYKFFGKKDRDYEASFESRITKEAMQGIYRVERIANPQLKFVYPVAKAFILPSKLEIFGMVLLEAMFLGSPVVSSSNGGSMSLIHNNGKYGQVVDEFDVEKWSKAVIRYLVNQEYARTVSKNAKELIEKQFNWDAISRNMIYILKNNGYEI